MGFDWEQVLGTSGASLADAYDEQASDMLHQDRPRTVQPGLPTDVGDEKINLPFDEV
ncbi:hypothetical protein [Streptomyces sp. NPDC007083]|uniref:hypothetical protein n=1 Tax=Streptomyces sp. NPDC007083 TaxID=3156913 RepID=UPI0033DE9BA0